jgi:hypothetical protein
VHAPSPPSRTGAGSPPDPAIARPQACRSASRPSCATASANPRCCASGSRSWSARCCPARPTSRPSSRPSCRAAPAPPRASRTSGSACSTPPSRSPLPPARLAFKIPLLRPSAFVRNAAQRQRYEPFPAQRASQCPHGSISHAPQRALLLAGPLLVQQALGSRWTRPPHPPHPFQVPTSRPAPPTHEPFI